MALNTGLLLGKRPGSGAQERALAGRSAGNRQEGMALVGATVGRQGGGSGGRAGAHVAGRARAVLPADSAEQAGTDSLGLMCLLPSISSLSSGWEKGEGGSLSHPPRLRGPWGGCRQTVGLQQGQQPALFVLYFIPDGSHLAGREPISQVSRSLAALPPQIHPAWLAYPAFKSQLHYVREGPVGEGGQ